MNCCIRNVILSITTWLQKNIDCLLSLSILGVIFLCSSALSAPTNCAPKLSSSNITRFLAFLFSKCDFSTRLKGESAFSEGAIFNRFLTRSNASSCFIEPYILALPPCFISEYTAYNTLCKVFLVTSFSNRFSFQSETHFFDRSDVSGDKGLNLDKMRGIVEKS